MSNKERPNRAGFERRLPVFDMSRPIKPGNVAETKPVDTEQALRDIQFFAEIGRKAIEDGSLLHPKFTKNRS